VTHKPPENDRQPTYDYCLVERASENFPALLADVPGPPEKLYVRGNVDALHLPALAIVGSRNPTRQGQRNAYEFARYLGRAGFCIVSGLAQGIDTAAHEGALDGGATTVAFLSHGIDQVHLASNRALADRIVRSAGALCSEFSPGTSPRRGFFPQRYRLISGLALGTLVVEAARRSGPLVTARLAGDQGREIFAIPGSIHNPLSHGCHQLIRQGAKLVESADDIISELGPLVAHFIQTPESTNATENRETAVDEDYKILLEAIDCTPLTADEIAGRSGLTIDQVSSMLLILELEGKIEAQVGGRYSRPH